MITYTINCLFDPNFASDTKSFKLLLIILI